ncbi:helix-turn-helix domain-containing protein [Streptomyces sp. NPDC056390]|uniref:helix-turn-helix domain-containing protein n=1 Tax=Streptomyces sp. NPDC056390 TaxID=3345806 RepID=UPI0035E3AA15
MIARDLRVSVRSVERWRRAWREGGMEALRSAGPANSPGRHRCPVRRAGRGIGQGSGRARLRR